MCHFNIRSRQGTESWGFPVVGKATGRKEARRKAVCILREAEQSLVKALLPQEPTFRVPPEWPIAPLEETLLNQLVVTTNVTTGTGRKEGRKIASRCAARHAHPQAKARSLARTHRRPTDERRDVRSAGMADWITARRGNAERTLTAAAGPSPCDPHRQALTMRPSLNARPLVS